MRAEVGSWRGLECVVRGDEERSTWQRVAGEVLDGLLNSVIGALNGDGRDALIEQVAAGECEREASNARHAKCCAGAEQRSRWRSDGVELVEKDPRHERHIEPRTDRSD